MANEGGQFDLAAVCQAFSCCKRNDGEILLDKYVEAYKELMRFFDLLGSVFAFVTSDVQSKIKILQQYLISENARHYGTVRSMINHEVTNNLTRVQGNPPSGSRTLLRLHRALKFIIRLFGDLKSMNDSDKISAVTFKAYDETLAQHHTWIVRKAVGLAVYAMPSRQGLSEKMIHGGTEEQLKKLLGDFVEEVQPVYDSIQSVYADNELLDLP